MEVKGNKSTQSSDKEIKYHKVHTHQKSTEVQQQSI